MNPKDVYLIQTDTTVGFLSQSPGALSRAKKRPPEKSYIKAVASLSKLPRIPREHKNFVRRAKHTTFICPDGESYRVVRGRHADFVRRFGWIYTTSANESGRDYDPGYAKARCDVLVETSEGLAQKGASHLIKLYKKGYVRLR